MLLKHLPNLSKYVFKHFLLYCLTIKIQLEPKWVDFENN